MFSAEELAQAARLTATLRDRHAHTTPVQAGHRCRLDLSHGRHADVVAGVVDDAARVAFTGGQCHAYAIAAALRTGYPLVAILTAECSYDEDCAEYPERWGWCGCQVNHFAVLCPDGSVWDVEGRRPVTDVLAQWEKDDGREQELQLVPETMLRWAVTHHTWREPRVDVALTFVDAALA